MTHTFTLTRDVDRPFEQTVLATRAALADQGFGIIAEIDLSDTLMDKLGVVVPAQVILGACRPQLAHRAVMINPSIAAMLPCNVVVRQVDEDSCVVEAFDPDEMARISNDDELKDVAADARDRLVAALDALAETTQED